MLGVVRSQLGFQDELESSVIFYRVSEFSIGGREDGNNFAGVFAFGYGIADRKFGHLKFLSSNTLSSPAARPRREVRGQLESLDLSPNL
jgi:hypothetical protein